MVAGPEDDRQMPGFCRRRIGEVVVVTALSDGYLDGSYDMMRHVTPQEAEALLAADGRPAPPRIAVHAFLVQSAGRTALIDTGSGDSMGPTLGRLADNLAAAGAEAGDIDTVLLTHMHPDHSNGLCTGEGRPVFARAELLMHADEVRHWTDDAAMARADERQRVRYFEAARAQLAPYRDRLRTFVKGEVFPNVSALPAPGHTPGHTVYLISSGSAGLLVWGDIVHVPEIQAARPEVAMIFDTDPDAAMASRRWVLEMATDDRLLVAGMHLHCPGFGHVTRRGDGFRIVPDAE